MRPRPHWLSLSLIAATIAAGLLVRMAPLGLSAFIVKYGGSTLWALMIYWLVTTLLPTPRIRSAALLSAGIATAVEIFKLYRSPAMDAFRATLAGTLLLGRYFSFKDILAYCIAIAAGTLLDTQIRQIGSPHRHRSP